MLKYYIKNKYVIYMTCTVILLLGYAVQQRPVSIGSIVSLQVIDKIELRDLHNAQRNKPLQLHLALDQAAQDHATWMANNEMMSHTGVNGSSPFDRLKGKQWTTSGENVAAGQRNPQEVTDAWMHSLGHRRNIQNENFKFVGFGIATSKSGTVYWCTVFSD